MSPSGFRRIQRSLAKRKAKRNSKRTTKRISCHPPASASPTAINPYPATLKQATKIDDYVRNFKAKSKSIQFRQCHDLFDIAVTRLAARKHFSSIESILENQKKYRDSMSQEPFVANLISLYGKAGMFHHACKLFDEMPQYGSPRTVFTFNALLYACVKCNRKDKLTEFFHELPEKMGIQPNVVSYNTVIEGFCATNDFGSAMQLLEEMEEGLIAPDIVSYNTIFEGYHRKNKLEEAEKLRERMEAKGVIADVWTYNVTLHSLIRNDQVQEAFELVENMVNGEVKPDMCSYDIVITQCIRRGKLDEVKILHSKMVGVDCLPRRETFFMLISFACDKGDVDFAFELSKQAFELKICIYRELMQLVVDSLTDISMIKEAKELVALVNSCEKHQYKIFL